MAIRIFIDQGHNPQNPNAGAEGNGYREQDLTYRIGVELARLLNQNPNFEARLSRNDPDEILGTTTGQSLRMRVDAANEWGADYFISLHTNASTIPEATGSEAFVFRIPSVAATFAQFLLEGLVNITGLPTFGVSARPTLYVLRRTQMPAVLVELGFITNAYDAELMATQPRLFAQGLYAGILNYFDLNT
jgi:N-acetylmuramoyl-L-alanine amidase